MFSGGMGKYRISEPIRSCEKLGTKCGQLPALAKLDSRVTDLEALAVRGMAKRNLFRRSVGDRSNRVRESEIPWTADSGRSRSAFRKAITVPF